MKKIVKLTESELERIVHKVLSEQPLSSGYVTQKNILCPILCGKKVLKQGSRGNDVKLIQNALAKCGYNKEAVGGGMNSGCKNDWRKCDGIFDVETKKAVEESQTWGKTPEKDGIVGEDTIEALFKAKCLDRFECVCIEPPIKDNPNSIRDNDDTNVDETVTVDCNKAIECAKKWFKKSNLKVEMKQTYGYMKCIGVCIPKFLINGDSDCIECPKYTNEMPGPGKYLKRNPHIDNCVKNGCTKVAY